MDEHMLVVAERDSLSREWVDKERSMRTSLKGGGTTGWSLVRARGRHCWFARESSRIRPLPV